ncbi:unnamed protein product [Adineta ricciae]|uniref:Uncharacterized protein n=2 Tax=Adineta ricciae TaxID=249248 RepID=A0A815UAJ9_ADIRI|nr:unnamed protein product [Adineta ricciae]
MRCSISKEKRLIDGYDIKQNIIFNISSTAYLDSQISFSWNEDVRFSFREFHNYKNISSVDYFSNRVHSLSYHLKYYNGIRNSLPNGVLRNVPEVSLFDESPFEHELILRIAKSFLLMETLIIINSQSQKDKCVPVSNDDDQRLSLVQYPRRTELILDDAHDDYIEQFLSNVKVRLITKRNLNVDYKSLNAATHHFSRDVIRVKK